MQIQQQLCFNSCLGGDVLQFEDLRVYDEKFNLLAILPEYISINWEIKFKEFGLGEIELERTEKIVQLLTNNKYLFVFSGDIQAIVTGYKIGDTVTVFLRTTEWLLTKYVADEFKVSDLIMAEADRNWTISELAEYILNKYLHPDFNIEFIGIDNDESDLSDFVSEKPQTMYSVIRNILNDEKYGFRFFWDDDKKRFVFLILKAQENNKILLCDEYKTAYDSEYSFDIQDEISGGIYYQKVTDMGKWNASLNEPFLTQRESNYAKYYTVSHDGEQMGLSFKKGDIILCKDKSGEFLIVDKAEPFLERIEPEENGIFSFSGILNAGEEASAKEEIKQKKSINMLTCKTKLNYNEDFKLGDIVRVVYFAGDESFEKKKLINEIHLWDEPDDTGAMPTMTDIE